MRRRKIISIAEYETLSAGSKAQIARYFGEGIDGLIARNEQARRKNKERDVRRKPRVLTSVSENTAELWRASSRTRNTKLALRNSLGYEPPKDLVDVSIALKKLKYELRVLNRAGSKNQPPNRSTLNEDSERT